MKYAKNNQGAKINKLKKTGCHQKKLKLTIYIRREIFDPPKKIKNKIK
jgi:hypothetical protein